MGQVLCNLYEGEEKIKVKRGKWKVFFLVVEIGTEDVMDKNWM